MKKIFLAQENADMTEGRGPMRTIAAFRKEDDVYACAKGRGVFGHGDGEVVTLSVYENLADWKVGYDNEIRRAALNKLSQEERKVFGLEL